MPIDNMTPPTPEEINNPDFQAVLKELLNVYQPILEEDLKRAQERQYRFSAAHPEQLVDARDAEALLRTRFFRRAAPLG